MSRRAATVLFLVAALISVTAPMASAHHEPGHPPCERADQTEVPCVDLVYGPFYHDTLCYMSVAEPQPPPGHVAWGGHYPTPAVYWARCTPGGPFLGEIYDDVWPGFLPVGQGPLVGALWYGDSGPSLAEVVAAAIAELELEPVEIGIAPEPGSHGGRVNLPSWMWVQDPDETTWGPQQATVTQGSWTVTATAQVDSVTWSMGDGSTVECDGPGVPYQVGYGIVDSPQCGYRYTTVSAGEPGGLFTVGATSHWTISWEAQDGQSGSETRDEAASVQIRIGEVQVLIVG